MSLNIQHSRRIRHGQEGVAFGELTLRIATAVLITVAAAVVLLHAENYFQSPSITEMIPLTF